MQKQRVMSHPALSQTINLSLINKINQNKTFAWLMVVSWMFPKRNDMIFVEAHNEIKRQLLKGP